MQFSVIKPTQATSCLSKRMSMKAVYIRRSHASSAERRHQAMHAAQASPVRKSSASAITTEAPPDSGMLHSSLGTCLGHGGLAGGSAWSITVVIETWSA